MDSFRYPIGQYEPQPFSERQRAMWLRDLAQLPTNIENAILNLDEAQLQTPYRNGGWTVHQLVHHVADSHINAFCRMKLTLSEDNPAIRPYEEAIWAEQADVKVLPINISITLLHALHHRMYALMAAVDGKNWERTYIHPATNQQHNLWFLVGMYAWHGKHHVAHITSLRERNGW